MHEDARANMTLAEDLAADLAPRQVNSPCVVGRFLASTDEESRKWVVAYFDAILEARNGPAGQYEVTPTIARLYAALQKNGVKIGRDALSLHMNKGCRCDVE